MLTGLAVGSAGSRCHAASPVPDCAALLSLSGRRRVKPTSAVDRTPPTTHEPMNGSSPAVRAAIPRPRSPSHGLRAGRRSPTSPRRRRRATLSRPHASPCPSASAAATQASADRGPPCSSSGVLRCVSVCSIPPRTPSPCSYRSTVYRPGRCMPCPSHCAAAVPPQLLPLDFALMSEFPCAGPLHQWHARSLSASCKAYRARNLDGVGRTPARFDHTCSTPTPPLHHSTAVPATLLVALFIVPASVHEHRQNLFCDYI